MELLQTSLADVQRGDAGHVRFGVTEPAASYRLPAIVGSFLSRYPGIRISIEVANTVSLSERLRAGELDLALCSAPDLGSELYFDPLFQEEFTVLLPERHPLAGRQALAPEDLASYRLLITAATCPYRRKLEAMLQESGRLPPDTMEIGSMTALPHYVAKGLGIALVPKVALSPAPEGTVVREIGGGSLDMTCGILCKASDYPLRAAGAKLLEHLRRELRAT
jgi:DNA-binding transcriptional LysR family regulator